jgi:hypothetical protein
LNAESPIASRLLSFSQRRGAKLADPQRSACLKGCASLPEWIRAEDLRSWKKLRFWAGSETGVSDGFSCAAMIILISLCIPLLHNNRKVTQACLDRHSG